MHKIKGLLLINLGTPKSPKLSDVFHYLTEFLTDRRVMDIPWLRRQLLVRGLIIPSRIKQSSKQYSNLWTPEGSPLLVHGKAVQNQLQMALGSGYKIKLAMRYQSPSIKEVLEQFKQEQLEEITILPLFPQYASATTGSVHQKVMETIQFWEMIPKLRFINHYCDHPALIKAFAERAKQYDLAAYDHFLFSFHGLPVRQIRKADLAGKCLSAEGCCQQLCHQNNFCYKAQCYATARGLAKQLGFDKKDYSVCFQSRLGKEPWIQPYLNDTLHHCVEKKQYKLLVFCPSFVCDCLETIYEIGKEYNEEFKKIGGEKLQLVEGLNSHPTWIQALQEIVLEHQ